MKVKWLGHASFLFTSEKGVRVITDPYKTGNNLSYGEIKESADVVTVSHDHSDHNNTVAVGGKPRDYRGLSPETIKGINFNAVATYHDDNKGKDRGSNVI